MSKIEDEVTLSARLNVKFQNIKDSNLLIQNNINSLQTSELNKLDENELDKLYFNIAKEFIYKDISRSPGDSALIIQKDNLIDEIKAEVRFDFLRQNKIENILKNIVLAKANHLGSKPRVLIVSAVPKEFRAFYKRINIIKNIDKCNIIKDDKSQCINNFYSILDGKNDRKTRKADYYVNGIISDIDGKQNVNVVLVLLNQYGVLKSYKATTELIRTFPSIEEVNLIGVCGHLNSINDKTIGDILVSKGFYDATLTKLSDGQIVLKNKNYYPLETVATKEELKWKPQSIIEKKPRLETKTGIRQFPQVFEANFACTSTLIDDKKIKEQLINQMPEADAVEMELKGCFDACAEKNKTFRIIKSISDLAHNKDKIWQAHCAGLASDFTVDYLTKKYGE